MMNLTQWIALPLVVIGATACGKSQAAGPAAVSCDAAAIASLDETLQKANGFNMNLADDKVKAEIAKAKAEIDGKRYAFKGCELKMQGNDEVSFGAFGADKDLDCKMKGGEEGLKKFLRAAIAIGQDKLALDVSGKIGMGGMKDFERLQLTECEITARAR